MEILKTVVIVLGALGVLVFVWKRAYNAGKKSLLIHLFKNNIITPDQYGELDKDSDI